METISGLSLKLLPPNQCNGACGVPAAKWLEERKDNSEEMCWIGVQ